MIKKMQIIGLIGVNASGKSTLAHLLSRDYVDYDMVATDNLLAINRMLNPNNPRLRYSSYSAWERLGKSTLENIWKGFEDYRGSNRRFLDCILRRARDQKVGMIIEGLHIEPKLFFSYDSELDVHIFLLYVSNEEKHKERIKQKCDYRPKLLKRLERYFPHIRTLQGLLIEEAKHYPVEIIETGVSKESSLKRIKGLLK